MIIWVVAMAGSIAAVCYTVAIDAQTMHLVATAMVTLGVVAAAVAEHRSAEISGASPYALAAIASRYMGLLWGWSAISSFVVYAFLLDWPHWTGVFIALIIGCALCVFVAGILDREGQSAAPDARVTALVGFLAKGQFALGAVLFGVLLALKRHTEMGLSGQHKWVALNLIIATSAGLLSLTGYLIMRERSGTSGAPDAEPV